MRAIAGMAVVNPPLKLSSTGWLAGPANDRNHPRFDSLRLEINHWAVTLLKSSVTTGQLTQSGFISALCCLHNMQYDAR